MKIDVVALFERNGPYWYWRGFNPIAALWTVGGFLVYMFVIPQRRYCRRGQQHRTRRRCASPPWV
jgi:cytosine/uracil/thiamine/allantoin permease